MAIKENDWLCARCGWSPAETSGSPIFAQKLMAIHYHYSKYTSAELYKHETDSFWFRNRNELIMQALTKHTPNASWLFESGCGTGFRLENIGANIPNLAFVGTDLHYEFTNYAEI